MIAKELIKKYGNDPYEIARIFDIDIIYSELGSIDGFFQQLGNKNFIHINENLTTKEQFFTLSHELGHFFLHKDTNINFLTRLTNRYICKYELEADLFASYFIISDDEIKEINHLPTIAINYNLNYRICEERMKLIK